MAVYGDLNTMPLPELLHEDEVTLAEAEIRHALSNLRALAHGIFPAALAMITGAATARSTRMLR